MRAAGIPKSEVQQQEALFAALEEKPDDQVTQLALADWLDEHDRTSHAECLRWLATEGKVPFQYSHEKTIRHHHDTWEEGWWWWVTDSEESPWGYPDCCTLPRKVWKRMDHTFTYDPCVFKEYPTVRQAIEALFLAWEKPRRRGKRRPKKGERGA